MEISTTLTVSVTANVPVEKAWKHFTSPDAIVQWYHASEDWHAPKALNDLTIGGIFFTRMESKDGSMGFDFTGTYTAIEMHKLIAFLLPDGRKVSVTFSEEGSATTIIETFDAETLNPVDLQRAGWQSILDNFKHFTENNG